MHDVDTVRYPLAAPGSDAWERVVTKTRAELRHHGCSVLPEFIRPTSWEKLRREGATVAPSAYYDVTETNVYNTKLDADLPAEHPGRIIMRRGNAFVPRDLIPADSVIHRLYRDPSFVRFVAACFELPALHELADPLSGLVLNVVQPGMDHPWHFDLNEFTVSLLTQEPEDGGVFEYCPNIRSAGTENFDAVRAVLTGVDRAPVRAQTLRPGDLQLFKGRYALHRVSVVHGDTARHTAIFAYSQRPGVTGSVTRTQQLFGRVLPTHRDAERHATRVDQLLD